MALQTRFEWDPGNLEKCQKHGVTIAEIEHVLDGEPYLVPDYEHSQEEDRHIAVGMNRSGRPVFLIFALRIQNGEEFVRPISARYMHRKEIAKYEHLWRSEGPEVQD